METYKGQLISSSPEKAYEMVQNRFQELLDTYSGKKSAKFARVIFANISFAAGDFDKAAQLYEEALKKFENEPFFHHLLLSNLGYCYENKTDLKRAAAYFTRIASSPDAPMKDEALFNLGTVYAEMKETAKSKDAYNQILSDHTDSIYLDIVKEKMSG
jgi:tetratricopeptide (TPR) repeat protein